MAKAGSEKARQKPEKKAEKNASKADAQLSREAWLALSDDEKNVLGAIGGTRPTDAADYLSDEQKAATILGLAEKGWLEGEQVPMAAADGIEPNKEGPTVYIG